MAPHPYGALSLAPPIVAIMLAIVTRRAVPSLLAGIFVGALITKGWHPLAAGYDLFEVHLWPTFVEPDRLRVFSFTLLMGAMIGVITASGGMRGFVRLLAPLARTRLGGQLTSWGLGISIFFDDYANTLLIGSTMRPVTDRLRISREKLAYLVDSTAAPVAGISILSTWVAIELSYLQEGIDTLGGVDLKAFDLFVASIPYRFYVLAALALIPIIAISGREFGPMLAAERKALRGEFSGPAPVGHDDPETAAAAERFPPRAVNAVLPIVVTLGIVLALLVHTGRERLAAKADPGAVEPTLRDVFGAADSTFALQYGALAGLLLAATLCWTQRLLSLDAIVAKAGKGARAVLPAIAILWCAATLSKMTGVKSVAGVPSKLAGVETYEFKDHRLYTGDYLAGLLAKAESDDPDGASELSLAAKLLPTAVFLLAAVVSFCTGTSFGTMGMLTPMVVTLSYTLLAATGATVDGASPLLLATVGSVLAGAVFGDHCSPISDTTILSSQSSGCDHIAHVLTQMPYALTGAAVAIGLGTLPAGFGAPVWLLLIAQLAALVIVTAVFGQKVEQPVEAA
ncbi:MAG: hypothetical protein KF847_06530 [Pirellulales bacterium]|nr:hypothetical protein [Pirellulales bacterium]